MYLPDIFSPEKDFLFPSMFNFDDSAFVRRPPKHSGERPPHPHDMMKMDVIEKDDKFEIKMNIPGYNKEDISIEMKDGYLEISARKEENKEEKDKEGRFIRRERFSGQCTRRLPLPKDITDEEIKASFDNGVLNLEIPKKEEKKPEKKLISIQ